MNSDNSATTTIDILRHGECEGGEIYRGSTDVPLSATGWQQMTRAVNFLNGYEHIICSPLQRCRLFAEKLLAEKRSSCPNMTLAVNDNFREIHFGEWEGRSLTEVWEEQPERVRAYYADPEAVTPPGGEPTLDVMARVQQGIAQLVHKHGDSHLLLVCHSGIIRLLLSHVLGAPIGSIGRYDVPYACVSRIRYYADERGLHSALISHNPAEYAE